ncbi:hypothetical protein ACFXJ5_40305 [Streptomyces sp. NPDC059373]
MNQELTPTDPLRRLMSLVEPPVRGGNTVDWVGLVAEYPHGFPDDYRAFMRVYGQGMFDDFVSVVPPIQEVYLHDLDATVRGRTADAQFTGVEEEYDEPNLLIGWGLTVDSDLLCWRADSADPNQWSTVIWRRQWSAPGSWVRFDCGMVELLCRYAERRIPHFWIEDLPYEGSRFVHSRELMEFDSRDMDPWAAEPAAES